MSWTPKRLLILVMILRPDACSFVHPYYSFLATTIKKIWKLLSLDGFPWCNKDIQRKFDQRHCQVTVFGKVLPMKFRIYKYTYSYSYPHIILSQFACPIPLNSTGESRQERSLVSHLVAGHSLFFYDYGILAVSCTNQRGKQHCLIHHTTNRNTDTRNIQHAL